MLYPKYQMKIGILGGSFDPPHKGHVLLSKSIKKKFNLKKILWMVTPQNEFKKYNQKNNFYERLSLSKDLTKKIPYIEVCEFEEKYRIKTSYDLIKKLNKIYPNLFIYWIAGADNLQNFHQWSNWKYLKNKVTFIISNRNNDIYKNRLFLPYKNFNFILNKRDNISSTYLRNNKKITISE